MKNYLGQFLCLCLEGGGFKPLHKFKTINHLRKLLASEPYLMDSPCLFGKGAGAALAARIIAKERFYM